MRYKVLVIAFVILIVSGYFILCQENFDYFTSSNQQLLQPQDLSKSNDIREMISGTIKEILERDNKRSLLIEDKQGTEYIFHINEHTIVLTFEKLKVDQNVDIIFNGILTRSIPPQGNAIIVDGLKI